MDAKKIVLCLHVKELKLSFLTIDHYSNTRAMPGAGWRKCTSILLQSGLVCSIKCVLDVTISAVPEM